MDLCIMCQGCSEILISQVLGQKIPIFEILIYEIYFWCILYMRVRNVIQKIIKNLLQ